MKNKFLLGLLMFLAPLAYAEEIVLTADNALTINDMFDADSVATLTKQAKDMDSRLKSTDPIYLIVHSPGGYIDDGLELIENLSSLRRPVHTITMFAASMGFQTVQGLGDRLVLKNGTLMSHKARGGMAGEFPGQLDSRYNYHLKRVMRMDAQAVARSKGKYTMSTYHDLIRDEFWCDGSDCVAAGFADRVVTSSCDKSLQGTYTVVILQDLVQGHTLEVTAELDKCPTNTNPVKYTILLDNTPLFPDNASKIAAAAGVTKTVDTAAWYNLGYSTSNLNSAIAGIDKDVLAQLKGKADEAIKKRQQMYNFVIRGY